MHHQKRGSRRPEPPDHDGDIQTEEMGVAENAGHQRQRKRARQRGCFGKKEAQE